jgi:glutathionylspermidine synthase
MKRVFSTERTDLDKIAKENGFEFHVIDGEKYWDESVRYEFTLQQIETDIEDPTNELHMMCLSLVDEIVRSEELLTKLGIPKNQWDYVNRSWFNAEQHLYGRIDLAYDGTGPAKLYELNYDTPTSLYEAGYFQWIWLEDMIKTGIIKGDVDQYNSIQDTLIEALFYSKVNVIEDNTLILSCVKDSKEDLGTIQYIRDCAIQAGLNTDIVFIEDICSTQEGQYCTNKWDYIHYLFKLYPWEFMMNEEFGKLLPNSNTTFFEPPWKSVLSNKGMLPLLWSKFKNHPNLLECYFDDQLNGSIPHGWVKKPIFSREGANIAIIDNNGFVTTSDGPYNDCTNIWQKFHPLPNIEGNYPLIGSWVIGDRACGMGIREDSSIITQNTSRFVPHIIL